jgi:predicted porin
MSKLFLLLGLICALPLPAGADGTLYGRILNPLVNPDNDFVPGDRVAGDGHSIGPWDLRLQATRTAEPVLLDLPSPQQAASAINFALNWGVLSTGVGYSDLAGDGPDAQDPWSLSAGYRFQRFGLSGGYGQGDPLGNEAASQWSLLGEYYFGDSTLRAMFSDRRSDDLQQKSWAVGLQHVFSERTRVYSELQGSDREQDSQVGFGLRYDF